MFSFQLVVITQIMLIGTYFKLRFNVSKDECENGLLISNSDNEKGDNRYQNTLFSGD